jgi:hypothetical protein
LVFVIPCNIKNYKIRTKHEFSKISENGKKGGFTLKMLQAPFGKELVLFDRGYPSLELIQWLQEKKIDFVMRVREKFDRGIDGLGRGEHERHRNW